MNHVDYVDQAVGIEWAHARQAYHDGLLMIADKLNNRLQMAENLLACLKHRASQERIAQRAAERDERHRRAEIERLERLLPPGTRAPTMMRGLGHDERITILKSLLRKTPREHKNMAPPPLMEQMFREARSAMRNGTFSQWSEAWRREHGNPAAGLYDDWLPRAES